MYCPRCGAASKDTDRFCGACGLDLAVYRGVPQYRPAAPSYDVAEHIPSYLGWAIAVLILCFWPTGIAAVIYAGQVESRLAYGNLAGARESSRKARMWCWITFAIGVAIWALTIALIAILIATFGTGRAVPGGFTI
jgi:hypothetical protein